MSQLPEDDSVFDQLSIHEVDSLDSIETDASLLVEPSAELEDDQECDEAAVPNLLINDTELAQLQGTVANEAVENVEQPPLEPRLWSLAVRKMPGSGKPAELLDDAGISTVHIVRAVKALL